jgi:16S rRNA A1518/A1519 N6-dimethyltransferase RsmA/KsgA/DIM1 with predicted DNA glycosylase/AP lyase activity
MLRNAVAVLAASRGIDSRQLEARFAEAAVDPRARAETLALEDFARLVGAFAD